MPFVLEFQAAVPITSDNQLPRDMMIENSIIRVLIMRDDCAKPLIASTVVMPQPEMSMLLL